MNLKWNMNLQNGQYLVCNNFNHSPRIHIWESSYEIKVHSA